MAVVRVFDTETTGLPEEGKPAGLLEVGWTDVVVDDGGAVVTITDPIAHLCNPFVAAPGLEIDPGAAAAHHIEKEDVAGCPTPEVILRQLMAGADVFACHNREFDRQFFTGGEKPMICTLKAAKRIWPTMERHSNQYLRYALKLPVDRYIASLAHRAGPDTHVTAHLLARMIEEGATLPEMIRWADAPVLLVRMPFGKHRGSPVMELPADYLRWLNGTELDRDMRHTLRHIMKQRGLA
ncbi:exodeoxyribonuclease X [Rhizobium subbaraonis]|uniref:Exodeoxyribonuclease X n=1 Tax=Rhizobium subbaraonis TaxID=908946 RepID=A0A285U5T6_9HYPH|nr:DUF3820 family protein [Rhizobium subbaraonis]SOC37047.1 exodeoxyribonuclease X [Rhizobium subbaraonis]